MSKPHTMLMRCQTIGKGGQRRLLAAAKHNLREIGGPHIDPERRHLNVVLSGPGTAEGLARLASERTEAAVEAGGPDLARRVRRKNGTLAAEIIFGLPASTTVDVLAYFQACLEWVTTTFGDVVLSAVVHLDESAPHAHVLMLPMKAGKWLASDVFGKKADIQLLQNDFSRHVGPRFGVRQAPARLAGQDKEGLVIAVLRRLKETDAPVLRCQSWPVVRDLIAVDPRPFAEQLGIDIKVKLRTLAQLKVSAGRGPRTERTPIGDRVAGKDSLCSVDDLRHAPTADGQPGSSGSEAAREQLSAYRGPVRSPVRRETATQEAEVTRVRNQDAGMAPDDLHAPDGRARALEVASGIARENTLSAQPRDDPGATGTVRGNTGAAASAPRPPSRFRGRLGLRTLQELNETSTVRSKAPAPAGSASSMQL